MYLSYPPTLSPVCRKAFLIILSTSHDLVGLWSRFPNYNWRCRPSSVAGGNRRLQPKGQLTFSLSPCLETINNVWEKLLCCADPYVADVLCSLGEVGWSVAARGVTSCFLSPPIKFQSDLFRSRDVSFGCLRHACCRQVINPVIFVSPSARAATL